MWGDPVSPQQPLVLSCRRSQVIEKFEALDIEKAEHMETNLLAGPSPSSDTRQGRSERRAFPRKRVSTEAWAVLGVLGGAHQHMAPSTHLDTLLLGFPPSFHSCLPGSLISSNL